MKAILIVALLSLLSASSYAQSASVSCQPARAGGGYGYFNFNVAVTRVKGTAQHSYHTVIADAAGKTVFESDSDNDDLVQLTPAGKIDTLCGPITNSPMHEYFVLHTYGQLFIVSGYLDAPNCQLIQEEQSMSQIPTTMVGNLTCTN